MVHICRVDNSKKKTYPSGSTCPPPAVGSTVTARPPKLEDRKASVGTVAPPITLPTVSTARYIKSPVWKRHVEVSVNSRKNESNGPDHDPSVPDGVLEKSLVEYLPSSDSDPPGNYLSP